MKEIRIFIVENVLSDDGVEFEWNVGSVNGCNKLMFVRGLRVLVCFFHFQSHLSFSRAHFVAWKSLLVWGVSSRKNGTAFHVRIERAEVRKWGNLRKQYEHRPRQCFTWNILSNLSVVKSGAQMSFKSLILKMSGKEYTLVLYLPMYSVFAQICALTTKANRILCAFWNPWIKSVQLIN